MKKSLLSVFIILLLVLTACGGEKNTIKSEHAKQKGLEYLANLKDGTYYIRHADNTCEELYLGYTTFDKGSASKGGDNSRVAWFKKDFDSIPVLYKGDSLILYTQKELTETFNFERFEDMGYSFGIIGLFVSPSGRYKVSTNTKNVTTYMDGDTDVILKHNTENIIIDEIGGDHVNVPVYDQNGNLLEEGVQCVSRCGSITGLQPMTTYEIVVYEGTEGYHYKWASDVRILASMEAETTHDFHFETETIIKIDIPDYYNSGFYMIDGVGMFRYVKEMNYAPGTNQNLSAINYNTPNVYPEIEKKYAGLKEGETVETDEKQQKTASPSFVPSNATPTPTPIPDKNDDPYKTVTLTIDRTGKVYTCVNFEIPDGESMGDIRGEIITPSGVSYTMSASSKALSSTFKASETGTYTIKLYNIGDIGYSVDAMYE